MTDLLLQTWSCVFVMQTQMFSSCFTKEKRERLVRIINIFACGLIVIQFCLWFDCHPVLFVVCLSSNSVCFGCHPVLFACGLIVIQFCLPVVWLLSSSVCQWFGCHPVLFACCLIVVQFCLSVPVVWLPSNSVLRLPAVRQVLWHHGEEVWSTGKGNHRLWWLHSVLCCTSGRHFSSVISLPERRVSLNLVLGESG